LSNPGTREWHGCQTPSTGAMHVYQTLGARVWQSNHTSGARVRHDYQTPAPWVWNVMGLAGTPNPC